MKFLQIILAIYLVALSCFPCADVEVNSLTHSSQEIAADHGNHSHDKENDLCPPFCVCTCCGQQIFNFSQEITFEFRNISLEIAAQIPSCKSTLTSHFFGSIWQPPQIA